MRQINGGVLVNWGILRPLWPRYASAATSARLRTSGQVWQRGGATMNRVSCDALSIEELVACVAAERDEARLRDLLARHAAYLDQPECYDALKAEADRHWMIDPHVSLHLAEAMVVAGELGAYPAGQALGLLARGNALVYLGRFHEAIEALDASGARFRSSGDAVGWARTRLSWIVASHRLGLGNKGRSSRTTRTIDRLCSFRLAVRISADTIVVPRRLPSLTNRQLDRLAPALARLDVMHRKSRQEPA